MTNPSPLPSGFKGKPRPVWCGPPPAARVTTAAVAGEGPEAEEKPRCGTWLPRVSSRPPPGSCFVSRRALRSPSRAQRGGAAAPPCGSFRVSISPPPPWLPFFISWVWGTRGVSSAGNSRPSSCCSGLRSCSPKVGSSRVWGLRGGEVAVFIFVFPPLPPAHRRPHPRSGALQLPSLRADDRASSVASLRASRKQGRGR